MRRARAQAIAVAACLALWGVSLALPALQVRGGPTLRGVEVLCRGWQGLDSGVYAWLANPFFVVAAAACLARAWRAGFVLAAAACLAGVLSFAAEELAARSGASVPAFAYATGFYVWLASLFGLAGTAARGSMAPRDAARR